MISSKRIKITCVPSLSEFSKSNLSERGVADSFTINANSYGKETTSNSQNFGAPRVTKEGTLCASKSAVNKLGSSEVICTVLIGHILGISPTHPEFRTQVKAYLMSIRRFIPGQLELDCDFNYRSGTDGTKKFTADEAATYFMKRHNDIEQEYTDNKKQMELQTALNHKTTAILELEEEKLSTDEKGNPIYGSPTNDEDYVTYLYALNHSKVVKDLDALDIAHQARFAMISDDSIRLQVVNQETIKNAAIELYFKIVSDKTKFYSMCTLYDFDLSIEESTLKSSLHDKMLTDFSLFLKHGTNSSLRSEVYLTLLMKYNLVTYNVMTDSYFDASNSSFMLGTGKPGVFQFLSSKTDKAEGFLTRSNILLRQRLKDETYHAIFGINNSVFATTTSASPSSVKPVASVDGVSQTVK